MSKYPRVLGCVAAAVLALWTLAPVKSFTQGATSQRPGSSILHQVTKTLTNAQIKALPSVPVSITSEPAAGIALVPVSCVLYATYTNATVYTNITAGGYIEITSGVLAFAYFDPTDLLAQTGNRQPIIGLSAPAGQLSGAIATAVSQTWTDSLRGADVLQTAIAIDAGNSGPYTGGDAANTLQISLAYFVLNTATGLFE